MAKPKEEPKTEKFELKTENIGVLVPQPLRPGVYSNLANVTITDNEVIIDFLNVNHKDKPPATLVSRVILPPKHAKGLLDALKRLMEKKV